MFRDGGNVSLEPCSMLLDTLIVGAFVKAKMLLYSFWLVTVPRLIFGGTAAASFRSLKRTKKRVHSLPFTLSKRAKLGSIKAKSRFLPTNRACRTIPGFNSLDSLQCFGLPATCCFVICALIRVYPKQAIGASSALARRLLFPAPSDAVFTVHTSDLPGTRGPQTLNHGSLDAGFRILGLRAVVGGSVLKMSNFGLM